jgi:hypothetical protein
MKTRVAALLLFAELARADEPPPAPTHIVYVQKKRDRGELLLAIKVGALIPQVFSKLQSSYLVDLELGYALPKLKHRLALSIEAAFTNPQLDGKASDPRLGAAQGSYSFHLEQRELIVGLTLFYRHPVGRWIPYFGVGPRLFLLQSKVSGQTDSNQKISLSNEDSTKIGVGGPLGLGVTLGPGHLFLEVAVNWAPIDHRTTGDTSSGALSTSLGYRLSF